MTANKLHEHCMRCGKKCNKREATIDGKRYIVYMCPGSEIRKNTWVGSHGEQRRELIEEPAEIKVEGQVS